MKRCLCDWKPPRRWAGLAYVWHVIARGHDTRWQIAIMDSFLRQIWSAGGRQDLAEVNKLCEDWRRLRDQGSQP